MIFRPTRPTTPSMQPLPLAMVKDPRRLAPPPPRASTWRGYVLAVAGGLVLGAFLGIAGWGAFFVWRLGRTETGWVTGRRWERGINVVAPVVRIEEDWSAPPGARVVDSFPVVREYRQVPDGWVSAEVFDSVSRAVAPGRGTGYALRAEREESATGTATRVAEAVPGADYRQVFRTEPVHAMRYRYETERWELAEFRRSEGSDQPPEWLGATLGPRQRERNRWERYMLTLVDARGKEYPARVSPELYARLPVGSRVRMRTSAGSAMVVEEAPPPETEDRP